jgi:glycosyltransferase involved in cell wall biosynthesis
MVVRRRYAVIHGVEEAGALACLLARLCRASAVFEKHSDPASYRKGAAQNLVLRVYAAVERWTMRRADVVVCTGEGLAKQAREAGAKEVHHIPDIPSSLVEPDPVRAAEWRQKLLPPGRHVLAMYVGSFAVYQGVGILFDAVPAVAAARPEVQFVVVGGSADEIEERTEQLAAGGCVDAVNFAGRLHPDELPHFLAAADLLLSPRLSGVNTPLKLLDYMKAGAAIVATDSEANRLILDESTAFLTEPTADGFASGIIRGAGDREGRRARVARGGKLIRKTYNFDSFAEQLCGCYPVAKDGDAGSGSA